MLFQLPLNIGDKARSNNLPGSTNTDPNAPASGFGNLVGDIVGAIMMFAAIAVLIYLLWGAVEWITASGDSGKLEKARQKMLHAVIGIVVLSATLSLFMILQQFLGICVLNFFGQC